MPKRMATPPACCAIDWRSSVTVRTFSRQTSCWRSVAATDCICWRLADSFARGIGIDLSPAMLRVARRQMARSPWGQKLQFTVDLAEQLGSVADASIDVVFSVGALEHMLDKGRVVANVFRVLRPGGRFICLTPNGHYLWYRWLAPLCRLETRHLSTDWYLSRRQLAHLLHTAGFRDPAFSYWTFIPHGDMHPLHAALLDVLDRCGRIAAPDTSARWAGRMCAEV